MDILNILREFGPGTTITVVSVYALFLIGKAYTKDNREERAYNREKDDKLIAVLQEINLSLSKQSTSCAKVETNLSAIQDDTCYVKEKTACIENDVKAIREDMIIVKERIAIK